jgi:hypothetical protein
MDQELSADNYCEHEVSPSKGRVWIKDEVATFLHGYGPNPFSTNENPVDQYDYVSDKRDVNYQHVESTKMTTEMKLMRRMNKISKTLNELRHLDV